MARVNIDSKAFTDPRFEIASGLMGFDCDKYSIFGRIVFLWNYCTEHETEIVPCHLVDVVCSAQDFSQILVDSGLAEWSDIDVSVRIKGTKDRIEWIGNLRNSAQKGGKARASAANRDERGHFQPANIQPPSQPTPGAGSSALSISTSIALSNTITKKPSAVFDLESLYNKYPRKIGKTKGLQKLKTLVKDVEDFKKVSDAIDRFIKYHRRENTGPQFIPHFSTFINSITDWFDEKAGSVAFERPKTVSMYKPAALVVSQTKDSETYSLKPEDLKNLIKKTIKPVDPEPA